MASADVATPASCLAESFDLELLERDPAFLSPHGSPTKTMGWEGTVSYELLEEVRHLGDLPASPLRRVPSRVKVDRSAPVIEKDVHISSSPRSVLFDQVRRNSIDQIRTGEAELRLHHVETDDRSSPQIPAAPDASDSSPPPMSSRGRSPHPNSFEGLKMQGGALASDPIFQRRDSTEACRPFSPELQASEQARRESITSDDGFAAANAGNEKASKENKEGQKTWLSSFFTDIQELVFGAENSKEKYKVPAGGKGKPATSDAAFVLE